MPEPVEYNEDYHRRIERFLGVCISSIPPRAPTRSPSPSTLAATASTAAVTPQPSSSLPVSPQMLQIGDHGTYAEDAGIIVSPTSFFSTPGVPLNPLLQRLRHWAAAHDPPTPTPSNRNPSLSSNRNLSLPSNREPSLSPKREHSLSPKREPSLSPKREPSLSPKCEPALSPKREPTLVSPFPNWGPRNVRRGRTDHPAHDPPTPTPECSPSPTRESSPSLTRNPSLPSNRNPSLSSNRNPSLPSNRKPSLSPKREHSLLPKREHSLSPKREPALSPKREPSLSPKRDPSLSPKREPSLSPKRDPSPILNDSTSSSPTTQTRVLWYRQSLSYTPTSPSPVVKPPVQSPQGAGSPTHSRPVDAQHEPQRSSVHTEHWQLIDSISTLRNIIGPGALGLPPPEVISAPAPLFDVRPRVAMDRVFALELICLNELLMGVVGETLVRMYI
ncbi:hypothetical protein C8Q80DRAFT_1272994 [Daedaleopsis nitida]|nr:hypothetical protein C8Q80DRAFT_1272994 [Daedaleopsis nitida]